MHDGESGQDGARAGVNEPVSARPCWVLLDPVDGVRFAPVRICACNMFVALGKETEAPSS
jgi:hypothetical protein